MRQITLSDDSIRSGPSAPALFGAGFGEALPGTASGFSARHDALIRFSSKVRLTCQTGPVWTSPVCSHTIEEEVVVDVKILHGVLAACGFGLGSPTEALTPLSQRLALTSHSTLSAVPTSSQASTACGNSCAAHDAAAPT
mmetsp:Transcript_26259/g.66695  ORF Transcript_26259/g.66695 Transcript_26259/m.66695 type:complete len:140 (-) Transcript_26259:443-862(-)|eukprot:CAMPEP_0115830356 /NCGR_PEP_ID=MMETSP0287-20121206/1576_1 /TAXON_ID=412157 /ORGANISM="Chrysochromulina rotalis, Strain UIO044" /LENGTH=139 /DNA_ID=CAMNT_0003283659 /DNA_START=230 /DNA_END=649 /DNA_ORIENTATION=-